MANLDKSQNLFGEVIEPETPRLTLQSGQAPTIAHFMALPLKVRKQLSRGWTGLRLNAYKEAVEREMAIAVRDEIERRRCLRR